MYQRSDMIYAYDGSLDGLMCCVFEAFLTKERPFDIVSGDELEPSLFSVKWVATDEEKAGRVLRAIDKKLGGEAMYLIQNGLCCCREHIELLMLDFLIFAFGRGKGSAAALGEKAVAELQKAVLVLKREAHCHIEFLRFSQHGGGLVSVIEPKNRVLPTIAPHFCDRFPNELFLIYDKTHKSALIHKGGRWMIAEGIEDFVEPQPDCEERFYRELWGSYFDAVAISERINPRCQLGHLPLRYRGHMTEFMRRSLQPAAFPAPGKTTPPLPSPPAAVKPDR